MAKHIIGHKWESCMLASITQVPKMWMNTSVLNSDPDDARRWALWGLMVASVFHFYLAVGLLSHGLANQNTFSRT